MAPGRMNPGKASEEEIKAQSVQLRLALAAAEMVTWEWDISSGSIRYSQNVPILARGEAIGPYCTVDGLLQEVHAEDREALTKAIGRTVSRGLPYEGEYRVRMLDGTYRWILARGKIVTKEGDKSVRALGISQDITRRKQAEQEIRRLNESLEKRVLERTAQLEAANKELRLTEARLEVQVKERTAELRSANAALEQRSRQLAQLAADLTTAEHRERRRLADLLHEQLQQLLLAARMQVHDLRKREELQDWPQLDILQCAVQEALTTIRDLTANLAPPVLLQKDMPTALQWLSQEVRRCYQLTVTLAVAPGMKPLTEAMSVLLFTAARELLLNVVKHAGIRDASLRLRQKAGWVELKIRDRGNGFDPKGPATRRAAQGFGLFSIQERVGLLGGDLTVNSAPGHGTSVTLKFPMAPPAPVPAPGRDGTA